MPKISELFLYPVKSCAAVRVPSLTLGPTGPEFDRHWMVVDAQGHFITQRECPRLACLRPQKMGESWWLEAPSGAALELTSGEHERPVQVWQSHLQARSLGLEAQKFLRSEVGLDADIVARSEVRPLKEKYQSTYAKMSFADSMPLLFTNQASLDDLNKRLSQAVPMSRFRPNVVLDGLEAYSEDQWARLAIGTVKSRVAKTCARCVMITIDQVTGERQSLEPLKVLASYRTQGSRVVFGQYLIHESPGRLDVGQTVQVD